MQKTEAPILFDHVLAGSAIQLNKTTTTNIEKLQAQHHFL
jgi:hypothetical protein